MSGNISRRDVLAGAASVAALAALGRSSSASPMKSDTEPLVVGSGEFRYEWVDNWLMPPSEIIYGNTHGVVQDSHGRIYVAHTVHADSPSSDSICVFDHKGKFLTSWGSQFKGGAHGLDIRKEGHEEFLYHCDIAHSRVVKTHLDGKVVFDIGAPQEPGVYKDGARFVPTNVAFGPHGDFYVADGYGSSYVHQYDSKANWIRTWGGAGDAEGKMNCPHGIWLDPRGSEPLLAVADRANHRIQYFSLDGKFVKFETKGMRLPCHFAIKKDLMLVPDLDSVVTILDHDDNPVVQLGDGHPSNLRDQPRSAFIPGKFINPHGANWVNGNDIVVVEWVEVGRVTLLRKLA